MKNSVEKFAALGLATTIAIAVAMVVHLDGQQASTVSGDFRNAAAAEVRDAQGQVLLRGTFAAVTGDDNEIEIQATLTSTESGGKEFGDAEVEYQKDNPRVQEVEFQVSGVPARAVLTLVLDGQAVLTTTADGKGRAEGEVNVHVAAVGQ